MCCKHYTPRLQYHIDPWQCDLPVRCQQTGTLGVGKMVSVIFSSYWQGYSFAEIAIGIIVGCVPTLPKFFKHLSSNMPALPSRFKALSSTSSQASWRRFFRWSKTSETSTNKTTSFSQNIFKPKTSGSNAPRIETLDLTRISFLFGERDLPTMALPVYNNKSFTLPKNNSSPENIGCDQTWYTESATPPTD